MKTRIAIIVLSVAWMESAIFLARWPHYGGPHSRLSLFACSRAPCFHQENVGMATSEQPGWGPQLHARGPTPTESFKHELRLNVLASGTTPRGGEAW